MRKTIDRLFNTDSEKFSKIIKDIIFIILISAIIGFAVNLFHPKGFTFVSTNREKKTNIIHISAREAKIKKDKGSALFLDSRQEDEFRAAHIPGALNIPAVPASVSVKKISENFKLISGPVELVIYCNGSSCGSSEILADKLTEMGYSRFIYIIKEGMPEWKENGFPVESTNLGYKTD